ncbi:hypothetical protein HNQ79_000372 [Streptomyces candidus]|uniref:Uncharacterized protein n=1 Tax=Streptomyces candidus TaxID=67283 RepID=A0A7X0LMZ3_9ACTN|nr:hypothetical protein [Streptomyces candidus]GHH33971.1 hypothetical protein GCM10018773_05390 [Streptomyces candidus]
MPRTPTPARRALVAVPLTCALLVPLVACNDKDTGRAANATTTPTSVTTPTSAGTPSPTGEVETQRLAKTRFVANASLAAGAAYQWIVKPYRAGKFQKGADGRKFALVKAGLAGGFTYNRLKAARDNAKGDPLLSKAVAPLSEGIESLKGLGTKLAAGTAGVADIGMFENVIGGVKDAGKDAGAEVTEKVPSAGEMAKGGAPADLFARVPAQQPSRQHEARPNGSAPSEN